MSYPLTDLRSRCCAVCRPAVPQVMIRNVLVIVVGIVVYGEETSANEFIGYLFALLGFVMYNLAKMNVFGLAPAGTATGAGIGASSGDKRPDASGSSSSSGEGGKYGSGGTVGTECGEEGSAARSSSGSSSSSNSSSSCCSRWLSIFRLEDLETEVYDQERATAQIRRNTGIYPGFNLSSYAPSSFSASSSASPGASSGAVSMVRLANLTGGKQRNLQSFSKDSDCEESAADADASETSRLLSSGGSGGGGGSSSSSSRSGGSGGSGDASNRKKKG